MTRRVSDPEKNLHEKECVNEMNNCLSERPVSLGRYDDEWNETFELVSMNECCDFEKFFISCQRYGFRPQMDNNRKAMWSLYCRSRALSNYTAWREDRDKRGLETGEWLETCDAFEHWVKQKSLEYFSLREIEYRTICELLPVDCCEIVCDVRDFSEALNGLFYVDDAAEMNDLITDCDVLHVESESVVVSVIVPDVMQFVSMCSGVKERETVYSTVKQCETVCCSVEHRPIFEATFVSLDCVMGDDL